MNAAGTRAHGAQVANWARANGLLCTTVAAIAAYRREL
jgi:hypothetical protein